MANVMLLLMGAFLIHYLTAISTANLCMSPSTVSLRTKFHYCLNYGFVAGGTSYTLMTFLGLDVDWRHGLALSLVPALIYFSVLSAILSVLTGSAGKESATPENESSTGGGKKP